MGSVRAFPGIESWSNPGIEAPKCLHPLPEVLEVKSFSVSCALVLGFLCVLTLSSCKKDGAGPAGSSDPGTSQPGMAGVDSSRANAAKALTEESLKKFIIYENEIMPHMALAMGAMSGDAATREKKAKEFEVIQTAAIKKAGLEQSDIPGLTLLTGEYYSQTYVAQDAEKQLVAIAKRVAEAKAQGKEPNQLDVILEETHKKTVADTVAFRKDFEAKYGKSALEILQRHETEYAAINDARMAQFTKKP
jgi:hypothetical protein